MTVLTNPSVQKLWEETIKCAEERCAIQLSRELEHYLIDLLFKYADKPEIAHQIFAKKYLEALQAERQERVVSLQHVGDQCLLFAGLFSGAAVTKLVKINYFVDLGRSAYFSVSQTAHDLFWILSNQFVPLMDVLQSIRPGTELLPIEAYEQWRELGSKRAYLALKQYTHDPLPLAIRSLFH